METAITDVPELFGNMVFNDAVMKAKLPKDVYLKLKDTIDQGVALDSAIADVVANAMMDWAMEKGATHYSHWFQPMTGITAEKHDSFISDDGFFRKGIDQGRAGCIQLSVRWFARHL